MSYRGEIEANTQITVKIGPFLDSTDGNTSETGLSIAQADIRVSKNGGNIAQVNHNQGGGNLTHDELGYYGLTLDTTDTNTEGRLLVIVHESGALLVELSFNVLSQAAFDSKYTAKDSGYMDVDIIAISGSTATADNVESVFLGTGDTDNVDLAARTLKLNSDTDVALEILSSDDSAIKAVSSASGKHGMELVGNVAGDGLNSTGGSTGNGLHAVGGATSGSGIFAEAATEGDGIHALAKGTDEHGILAQGGDTSGNGIHAEAITEGDGVYAKAIGTDEHGIYAVGGDTTGDGIKAEAATSGDGILAIGATNGHGLNVDGAGSGEGISATGGATGAGIEAVGGATSGAGIKASAQNNDDAGMELVKNGTGSDLDADDLAQVTSARMGALTDWIDGGRLDNLLDAIPTTAMRGTDSANTTVPDAAGTAASLHSTTDGKVDAVQGDVTTIAADVANIDGDAMRGTNSANTTVPDSAGTAASLHSTTDGKVDAVQGDVTTIAADVVNIDGDAMRGTNSANTTVPDAAGTAAGLHSTTDGKVDALENISAADVNTQMVDVMNTDTHTLPGQEAPTATPTYEEMQTYLYKFMRNKMTTNKTTGEVRVFADNGSTIDQESTMTDDGTIFTRGEFGTGA